MDTQPSIARKLQEVAAAKLRSIQVAAPTEDLSDVDVWVDEIMKQVAREAEDGKFETIVYLTDKSSTYVVAVSNALKKALNDVMVIFDLGAMKIRVSWYRSNEC